MSQREASLTGVALCRAGTPWPSCCHLPAPYLGLPEIRSLPFQVEYVLDSLFLDKQVCIFLLRLISFHYVLSIFLICKVRFYYHLSRPQCMAHFSVLCCHDFSVSRGQARSMVLPLREKEEDEKANERRNNHLFTY